VCMCRRLERAPCALSVALVAAAVLVGLAGGIPVGAAGAAEPPATAQLCGELTALEAGGERVALLHLWGSPYEMGYAHGALCREQVRALYANLVGAVREFGVGVEMVDAAWAQMAPHVPQRYLDEMRGLADGAGVELQTVQRAHAVPDLSEFHCTFFAAWGDATADGHLHQIRALDYEMNAGIQQHPALIVCEPQGRNAFVAVGWPGFIGCVSGMNAERIALSEIGEHFSDEVETLAGMPMPFLMRRALEDADSLDDALAIFEAAERTSSYLYCVGDAELPGARALRTSHDFCEVWAPEDFGELALPEVVAWSMGEDSAWNRRVYDALAPLVGRIDESTGMEAVMRGLGTGNLHAVHYDVTDLELWVANATPGPDPEPAYTRPFVHFDLAAFLETAARSAHETRPAAP